MTPKWLVLFAAGLVAGIVSVRPASAQLSVAEVPAAYRGAYTCPAKFPGSFLDPFSAACWQCPSTHPRRTVLPPVPITASNACERPSQTLYRKAYGPENPTGLSCRTGWFRHWDLKCYSCGSGYGRTTELNIASPGACSRTIPAAWTTATRRGVEGCPKGAFRNGLTASCYSCPSDYSRNALIADDLTKVNACTKVSVTTHDQTRAKFLAQKDSHAATRDNLAGIAGSLGTFDPNNAAFDTVARRAMKLTLDREIARDSPFDAITLLVSGGLAAVAGYTHGFGYVMSKSAGAYECRKTWANTFTAGLTVAVGAVLETGFATEVSLGSSESNGWQVEYEAGVVAAGFGLQWEAPSGALSVSLVFGPGFGGRATTTGDYTHTWAETANAVVACDKITWGAGWKLL